MTIVVGYVPPTPEGEAALTQAIAEAKKSNATLLVINSSKGDAWWTTGTPRSRTSRASRTGSLIRHPAHHQATGPWP